MQRTDFINRIGKEEIYLLNDYEDMVFRISADPVEYYAKIKGKSEFITPRESKVLTDAIIEQKEISAEEYNSY